MNTVESNFYPLLREQAFGEALDPAKLEEAGACRHEIHLDRKLERMLSMLLQADARGERIAALLSALGDAGEARATAEAPRTRQLALQTIGPQREARADIAYHFGMREEHLLHGGRQIAHVQHRRPVRTHRDEGRFLDRIVADGMIRSARSTAMGT